MLTKEDLLAISQLMDEKLEPIKTDISEIKEQLKDIDTSIGTIADWADKIAEKEKIPFASGNLAI